MKRLDNKELSEILKRKLAEVESDASIPEWDAVKDQLTAGPAKAGVKFIFSSWIAVLLLLAPHQYEGIADNQPIDTMIETSQSNRIMSIQVGHEPEITRNDRNTPLTLLPKINRLSIEESTEPLPNNILHVKAIPEIPNHRSTWTVSFRIPETPQQILPGLSQPSQGEIITQERKRNISWQPHSIGVYTQISFHTLTPFMGDENRLASTPEKVSFADRLGFRLQANYHLNTFGVNWKLGPILNGYQSRLNYVISNDVEDNRTFRNSRLDLGAFISLSIPGKFIHLPGYVTGELSSQWQLVGLNNRAETYGSHLTNYAVGYGLNINNRLNLELHYRSFLSEASYPGLGQLRPHFYSFGGVWKLK